MQLYGDIGLGLGNRSAHRGMNGTRIGRIAGIGFRSQDYTHPHSSTQVVIASSQGMSTQTNISDCQYPMKHSAQIPVLGTDQ